MLDLLCFPRSFVKGPSSCHSTIFFGDLHSSEIRKLAERLINYVISKGTFLPLVVPPTLYQAGLWSTWLAVLCFLKMFQALARDRLERLNASPSATPWSYFRVYSALLLVLSANLLWLGAELWIQGTGLNEGPILPCGLFSKGSCCCGVTFGPILFLSSETWNRRCIIDILGSSVIKGETQKSSKIRTVVISERGFCVLELLESREVHERDLVIGSCPYIVVLMDRGEQTKTQFLVTLRVGPVVWAWDFHVGGLEFETPCQRKQGVCLVFWVELVAPACLVRVTSPMWMRVCLIVYKTISSSLFLLLFFEPLSIAFETLQAILVHGFQLLDIYIHDSANDISNSRISKLFDISAAVERMWKEFPFCFCSMGGFMRSSFGEWKGVLIRNMGFLLDMLTLLMALAHYVHIWWLHGMAFHLVDAILFLNIRALLSAIVKRVKGFIKLRIALGTLHGALPDATLEELQTYDDECAICREPMAKAKKLSCNHLFHLACLRSWLDQGLTENYSCPTCRKPLFIGRSENEVNPQTVDVRGDELLAREMSMGLDQLNLPGHALQNEASRNQMHNPLESSDWRSLKCKEDN
ncbi:hypothetical protein MTR67_027251 [Solanum verrucosum]|uniref:RING-type domain-containing protein n=1 Tax=Solanum verrucosum TaxID=315347 RepID=A0AAF0R8T3_SOLVR|nr:hypothetical protein MTR67_027251 [Solanum verrucosum]